MRIKHYVVDITDEADDLVGHGICKEVHIPSGVPTIPESTKYTLEPQVYGTRSEAHAALPIGAEA